MPPSSYNALDKYTEFCFEEKRSRFHAQLWPAKDKETGQPFLTAAARRFPDARHHCWAYLYGDPQQASRAGFNDDGEPSGTAGKPMLHVLTQRKIGDVFAVVSRYFGGVKLGAGGLTRAYGQAVSCALDAGCFRLVVPLTRIHITADYHYENTLRTLFLQFPEIENIQVEYKDKVTLSILMPQQDINPLTQAVANATSGTASIIEHHTPKL